MTPGRDWQGDIDAGIDAAGWFALLVSAESLASRSVADEIQRARDRGKPLYLLILDATPLRLVHAPGLDLGTVARGVFDLRRDFDGGVKRFFYALRSGEFVCDAVSRRGPLMALRHLPRSVREVAAAMALPLAAMGAVAAIDAAGHGTLRTRAGLLTVFTLVGIAIWLVYALRQLLHRRLQNEPLFLSLFAGSVGVWSGIVQTQLTGFNFATALAAGTTAAGGWAIWRAITDADLMRWIPQVDSLGYNMRRRRQFNRIGERVTARLEQQPVPTDGRPYSYRLVHASDDQAIADIARSTLASVGASERVATPSTGPTIDLLLLSNRICADEVRAFLNRPSEYRVVLIASAVSLPPDLADALVRVQWLEFRELLPYQLGTFVLTLKGYPPARLLFASNVRPHAVTALTCPLGIRQMIYAARTLGMFWLAGGLLAVIGMAPVAQAGALVLAAWQFASVHWLYRRLLPLPLFVAQFLANAGLAFALGTAQLVAERVTVSLPGVTFSPRWTIGLIVFQAVAPLLQVIPSRRWMPRGWRRRCALDGPPAALIARGHLLFVLLAIAGTLFMALNTR